MKKFFAVAFVTMFVSLLGLAPAVGKGTEGEATMLLLKVTNYLQINGKEKTIAEVNNPKGQLQEYGLHIVIHDMTGKVLASGVDPKLVGTNQMDWKDADGKPLIKERIERLQKVQKGLQDFRLINSKTKKIERMSSMYEKKDSLIISCDVSL